MRNKLLEAEHFSVQFADQWLVDGINFNLDKGETLGIVGESGSGKSLSSLAIMGLLDEQLKAAGKLFFKGRDLLALNAEQHRQLRGTDLAMIFQEPMSALNPSMSCGAQVAEMFYSREKTSRRETRQKVLGLFEKVRLPRAKALYHAYPHQLSGGQKQRVMIAMALAANPSLLIADEPTTALDVSVQQSVLTLLKELQEEFNMGMVFISHDLAVVERVADRILVMRKGKQVEYGAAREVFTRPEHPYTKGLLACRPTAGTNTRRLPLVEDFLKGTGPSLEPITEENRMAQAEKLLTQPALLEVRSLDKYFGKRSEIQAVKGVGFSLYPGESLGLVGESGSGKTTIGRILCGLEKASAGTVFYKGEDLAQANSKAWKKWHREIQIIFQDPFASLNPRIRIGEAIAEVLIYRKGKNRQAAKERAEELLQKTGLDASAYHKYPHEFSGGQRQRIGIARALAMEPGFIVCDESVSALDVSVQAQILNLLNDLKEEFGFTYLFISHDLAVVKYFCHRVLVLQHGALVESGFSDQLYRHPQNPYTKMLIEAMPDL